MSIQEIWGRPFAIIFSAVLAMLGKSMWNRRDRKRKMVEAERRHMENVLRMVNELNRLDAHEKGKGETG